MSRDVTEQGARAYLHAHGEIWETLRNLHDAFQVDTGQQLSPLPAWNSLTEFQQCSFVAVLSPMMKVLARATYAIAGRAEA